MVRSGGEFINLCFGFSSSQVMRFPCWAASWSHSTEGGRTLSQRSATPREPFPCYGCVRSGGAAGTDSSPWSLWHRLVFQSLKPTPPPCLSPPSGAPRRHPASSSGPGRSKGKLIRPTREERVGCLAP